ncbi:MAG TPA: nuclear transport factor 2 family protein [Isosphaeraceae bacterium]
MNSTDDANLATVRAIYDALFGGDVMAVIAAMHDDAELEVHGPPAIPFVGRHKGRDELARFFGTVAEHVHREPGDPVPAVHEYVVQGDKVVAIGVDRVTSRATGSTYEAWWVHVFDLRAGKVARVREFFDTAAALEAFRPAATA